MDREISGEGVVNLVSTRLQHSLSDAKVRNAADSIPISLLGVSQRQPNVVPRRIDIDTKEVIPKGLNREGIPPCMDAFQLFRVWGRLMRHVIWTKLSNIPPNFVCVASEHDIRSKDLAR